MYWIKIPPDVPIVDMMDEPVTNPETGERAKVKFEDFFKGRLIDQSWAQSWEWGDAQIAVKAAWKKARDEGSEYIALERTDYEKLKSVVLKPHQATQYPGGLMHLMQSFKKAIVDATDEDPKAKEEAGEAAEG